MLIVGFFMGNITDTQLKATIKNLHKLTGLLVLTLVLLRMLWALYNVKPTLPDNMSMWGKKIERVAHILIYLLLLAMPLSGWIMSTAAGKPPVISNTLTLPLYGIPHDYPLAKFFANLHNILAWSVTSSRNYSKL